MIDFGAPILDDHYHRRRMIVGMTKGREAVAAFDRARGNSFENITILNSIDEMFPPGSPTRRLVDVTLPDGRTIYGMTAVDCARDRGVALPSNAAWHSAPIVGPGYVRFPPDRSREQRSEWFSRQPFHASPSPARSKPRS